MNTSEGFAGFERLALPETTPEWFAAFTAPRHEKQVARHLDARHLEHFLPTYQVVRRRKNRTAPRVMLPLFPNYIFIRIQRAERVRVLEVPGVLSIVGAGTELSAIPQRDMEALQAGVASGKAHPYSLLTMGRRVRIKSGPMAGVEGFLAEPRGSCRFVLTLELIRQSVAIEVEADNLDPLC